MAVGAALGCATRQRTLSRVVVAVVAAEWGAGGLDEFVEEGMDARGPYLMCWPWEGVHACSGASGAISGGGVTVNDATYDAPAT